MKLEESHRRYAEDAEKDPEIKQARTHDLSDDPVTREIIGAAFTVHRTLGPGLLQSAYQACLLHEIRKRGLSCEKEVAVPVVYDGQLLDCGYRIDILVQDLVIVEVKCVERVLPVHFAQLLTYMRLANKERGLLLNFHEVLLRDGIHRRVLTRPNPWLGSTSTHPTNLRG